MPAVKKSGTPTDAAEKLEMVLLADLVADKKTQARAGGLSEAVVVDYAATYTATKKGGALGELRAVRDPDGVLWVWDGHHRHAGAGRAGKIEKVPCKVRPGTLDDAIWLAFSANKEHGLRRSNDDKASAVRGALKHRPGSSDSAIADHVGVDQKTVSAHRRTMVAAQEIPEVTTRKGSDGKEYDVRPAAKANVERGDRRRAAAAPPAVTTPEALSGSRPAAKPRTVRDHDESVSDEFEIQIRDDRPSDGEIGEDGAMASGEGTDTEDGLEHSENEEAPPFEQDDAIEPPAPGPLDADAEDRAIPAHALWAWKEWPTVLAASQAAGDARRILERLVKSTPPAGPTAALAREMAGLALRLQDALEQAEPRVCPRCDDATRGCFCCGDQGWIHLGKYEAWKADPGAEVAS